ncbi:MAG: hypothetical protein K6B46_00640 [Opitutales bacterium]|nr:hypothetical protein [Opitutales bacterium]
MKKVISVVLISSLLAASLFADLKDAFKVESRDGIDYVDVGANVDGHIRDRRFFINFKDLGVLTALFAVKDEEDTAYSVISKYKSPMSLMRHRKVKSGEIPISIVAPEEEDLVLFRIYSQMNLDEILQQIKSYPEEDFEAIFQMLYMISQRVATVSDKRKIMDAFFEHFNLNVLTTETPEKINRAFSDCWIRLRLKSSPLASCFVNYAIEYADYLGGMSNGDDIKNAARHMLQNFIYASQNVLRDTRSDKVPAETQILYYVYSKSLVGIEQGVDVPETWFPRLKEKLGKEHVGIRLAEIQDRILSGELNPEFSVELREIADRNYAIAFPVALDFARRTKMWDDVAYYAYLCLKQDVYGFQKQALKSQNRLPCFDYLDLLLEALSRTDAQAAGTLYEFVAALPPTTRRHFFLFRAERILDGVDYDKALAQKEGRALAEKGFYENEKLEARFRATFEKRLND